MAHQHPVAELNRRSVFIPVLDLGRLPPSPALPQPHAPDVPIPSKHVAASSLQQKGQGIVEPKPPPPPPQTQTFSFIRQTRSSRLPPRHHPIQPTPPSKTMPYTAAQRHSAPGATRSFVDQEQPGLSDSKLQTTNAIRTVIDLVDTSENKLRTVRELQNDGRNNLEADDGTPYEYKPMLRLFSTLEALASQGCPKMEKMFDDYGYNQQISSRSSSSNPSKWCEGIEALEPGHVPTELQHKQSSRARENLEIAVARAHLGASRIDEKALGGTNTLPMPSGLSPRAQRAWQRPLHKLGESFLPGGTIPDGSLRDHMQASYGHYHSAVQSMEEMRRTRKIARRRHPTTSDGGREGRQAKVVSNPRTISGSSVYRTIRTPTDPAGYKSARREGNSPDPKDMYLLMQRFPNHNPEDILQLHMDPSYREAYGFAATPEQSEARGEKDEDAMDYDEDMEIRRILANEDRFHFSWTSCAEEKWMHKKGIMITYGQLEAAERAERETPQIFARSVLKKQFVNAIQNADAHESVLAEDHIQCEPRAATPRHGARGAAAKDGRGERRAYRRHHHGSAPGTASTEKLQASSDLTPRARIQGLIERRAPSRAGRWPPSGGSKPSGTETTGVVARSSLTAEKLLENISMEEITTDARLTTNEREGKDRMQNEIAENRRRVASAATPSHRAALRRPASTRGASREGSEIPRLTPEDFVAQNKALVLSHRALAGEYMPSIVSCIKSCSFLTAIRIDDNIFLDLDLSILLVALRDLLGSQVTELDISNNKRLTWECSKSIAAVLGNNSHTKLSILKMEGVHLGDKGLEVLGPAIASSTKLRLIDMRRCGIGDLGSVKFAGMLLDNSYLEVLRLGWNNIRAKGGKALAETVRTHPTLRGLDLSHNAIGDVGGSYMAQALVKHRSLEWVDLSYNHLEVGSSMALGEVVRQRTEPPCTEAAEVSASGPHTVPLNTLKIDGNEIGLLGGLWLLRGLAATESQGAANGVAPRAFTLTMHKCSLMYPIELDVGPGKSYQEARMTLEEALELDTPAALKPPKSAKNKKAGDGKGKKDKAAGLQAPRLYSKDARKLYAVQVPKEFTCTGAQTFNPQFPQVPYELDISTPANFQVWKELYRFWKKWDPVMALKQVKLDGKTVKPDELERLGKAAAGDGLTGKLTLTAAAPLILPEDDTKPAPENIIDFCLLHMKDPGTLHGAETAWMLEMVKLITRMFWFSSTQAQQLLERFPSGSSQTVPAALLLLARCVDPLDFDSVLKTLDDDQLAIFKNKTGILYHFDPRNLTGRYTLNLSESFQYTLAKRLRDASIHEAVYDTQPFLVNWRNATLDGRPLNFAGPMALDCLTVPHKGILSLDYVSQVEIEGEQGPQDAGNGAFVKLMEKIRLAYRSYTCKYQDILDGVRVQPLRRADSRNHAGYHERKGFAEIPSAGVEAAESPSNGGKLKAAVVECLRKEDHDQSLAGSLTKTVGKELYKSLPERWWHGMSGIDILPHLRALLPIQRAKFPQKRAKVDTSTKRPGPSNDAGTRPSAQPTGSSGGEATSGEAGTLNLKADAMERAGDNEALEGLGSHWPPRKATQPSGPPDNTVNSSEFSVHDRLVAHYVMSCTTQEDLKFLLGTMEDATRMRAMKLISRLQGGFEVCAAIMEEMPGTVSTRHLLELQDYQDALLPEDVAHKVMAVMHSEALARIKAISRELEACGNRRVEQVRSAVLRWGSTPNYITCRQLSQLVTFLKFRRDRMHAITALWTRIVDKDSFVPDVVKNLSSEEQVDIYRRLGYYKLTNLTPRPYGVHFRLQLKTQEGRDTAMRLCHLATTIYKARQKEKVKGSNLLMNLTGDGRNLILTEDEKLWGMVEKYFILEFDVDTPPTAESNLKKKARAVSILQRKWRNVQASKRWHDALSAIKSGLADRSLGGNKTVTVSGTAALDGTERPPSISSQLRRKLLWEQLIEASMPDSIERLIDDMENIEAVGKIHHAMGRSRAKRGSG